MRKKRNALLAGATGLVGGHCLQFLLNDDAYDSVSVLLRKEIPLKHPKLRQIVANFNNIDKSLSLIKADDVFCCLGTTIKKAGSQANFKKVDLEYPVKIAENALSNGASQFILITAMGADKKSFIFYNRVKGEAEAAIRNLPYEAVHIFRPSLLLGERKEVRTGEKAGTVLFNIASPLFIGPLRKFKAIEGKAVAGAMVACAKRDGEGVFIYESNEIQRVYDKNYK